MDRLADCFGGELGSLVRKHWKEISEIRLRCSKKARIRFLNGNELAGELLGPDHFHRILSRLMGDSLYACEEELKQGYFTMPGGVRVGVCGRLNAENGCVNSMAGIGSVCIRIPREILGCSEPLWRGRPENMLILSEAGRGKTTLLRDLARTASNSGFNVSIADERREIAACREGVPQFDLGERIDVMDGCPKAIAIGLLIRACAPDWIVADEIGGEQDACAILDAIRCGAKVAATAHASCAEEAEDRFPLLFRKRVFRRIVLLGPEPGRIRNIQEYA